MTPDQTTTSSQPQTNQTQTPLEPNTVELKFDLNLEDAQPTPTVETPTVEIPTVESVVEAPVETSMIQLDLPTQTTDVKDTTWLQESQPVVATPQETIATAQEIKKTEEPVIQEKIAAQEQSLEFLTPAEPVAEQYVPTVDAFNQTVDVLKQQEGKQGEVSLTPQEQPAQPFSGGVNLDDVLKTLTPTASQSAQQPEVVASPVVESPQPVVSEQVVNPFQVQDMNASQYSTVSTPAPEAVVQQPVTAHEIKHWISPLKIAWLSFVLLILWWFVVKTMYPVEFNSLLANVFWVTQQEQIVPEYLLTWNVVTGDVEILSWDTLITDDLLSWTQDTSTWFDAFTELDTLWWIEEITPVVNPHQATILQLQDFAVKGQEYLDLWRKTNDSVLTKYGLFISKKATELVTSLENGEQIDTQVVETYIASFSGYLNKLSLIVNDTEPQAILPIQETPANASSGEIPMIDMNSWSEEIPAIIN